ncbi:MAG: Ig-like domain-containing protein [Candidatus Paceibacterota bacterium]
MDKKLTLIVLVFLLVFATFVSTVFISNNPGIIKAQNKRDVSMDKSLIFCVPPSAQVGGFCDVSVVTNDEANKAVSKSKVCVSSDLGTVAPGCSVTDKSGIATFRLTSNDTGTANTTATINGASLGKSCSCEFTN